MANLCWYFGALVCVATYVAMPALSDTLTRQQAAADGLRELRRTYDLDESFCGLGFIGAGSPITITRVSPNFRNNGVVAGDTLIAVNNHDTRDRKTLRSVLSDLKPGHPATLTIKRDGKPARVTTICNDALPILEAREQALRSASEGQWDECVRATYLEEILWGAANSESADLRLWCHEERRPNATAAMISIRSASTLSRLHARLIYEHASLLIEEISYLPDRAQDQRNILADHIQQISDAGHLSLTKALQAKMAMMDGG